MTEQERVRTLEGLVDELEAVVKRNNAIVGRLRSEMPMLMLAIFTSGFAAGVAITRLVQG